MKEILANKLYDKLIENGEIVCDSPVLRLLIYIKLKDNKLEYTTETIGDTGGSRSLCPYNSAGLGYSPKRIIKWLNQGRIYQEDLLSSYDYSHYKLFDKFTRDNICDLYCPDITKKRKLELVTHMCYITNKYSIFDHVILHKLIKKISLKLYSFKAL